MKKDMISIIVGKIKKDKNKSEDESMSSEEDEGMEGEDHALESSAESLLEAIQDEDPKAMVEALKSFIECCKED